MTPTEKQQYVRSLLPVTQRVRTDVSAVKADDGSSRWTGEALTTAALERHVNGGPARGVCPIKAGEDVTLLALFDLDSHRGATSWDDMLTAAGRVADALLANGYPSVAWRSSGGRGIHLYVLWDTPQDAYSVRQAMTTCLAAAGFSNGARGVAEGQVEVFPKQDSVAPDGFGNQFILPLAGHSEPLDLDLGLAMGRDAALDLAWPTAVPVPVLQAPERVAAASGDVEPLNRVREALFAIPNDGVDPATPDYDRWFRLCSAVHEATGGSDDGADLFSEWSAQNYLHDEQFFRERVWHYVKSDRGGARVTRATLYGEARSAGWLTPTDDGFDDVEGAEDVVEPLLLAAHSDQPATHLDGTSLDDSGQQVGTMPAFIRKDDGRIKPVIGNLLMACRRPEVCHWRIAHDTFRDEIMVADAGSDQWRPLGDVDYTRMREFLEKGRNGFDPIGKEMMRDAMDLVAKENVFDSAQLWLNSLEWDGVERIETFYSRYLRADDTPYTRASALYTWTALAGRVMDPACQADMTPILVGPQGTGKTSAVTALAPSPDFCCEVSFTEKDDDLSRKMRGKLIAEIGELRGLRTKEIEAIKAFISRRYEEWIPKFKEFGTKFPRRLLFIGTTNASEFLADATGNRRWLPIRVGETDMPQLRHDVLQLWAEARVRWSRDAVLWKEAERLARAEHREYQVEDPWTPRVQAWLESPDMDGQAVRERPYVTTSMVLTEALRLETSRTKTGDSMRAADVLKTLGFARKQIRVEKHPTWVYAYPPVTTLYPPENDKVVTEK